MALLKGIGREYGNRVLDVTEEQILEEYKVDVGARKKSSLSIFASVVGVLVSIVALAGTAAITAALGFVLHKR